MSVIGDNMLGGGTLSDSLATPVLVLVHRTLSSVDGIVTTLSSQSVTLGS